MPLPLSREEGLRRLLERRKSLTPVAASVASPLRSGIENVKATGHGLRAQFYAETGDDAAAEAALRDAAAASEHAAALAPRVQSYEQIESPADAVNYATGLIGTQLPNLAVTAAGALLGRRALGPKIGPMAGGTVAGTGLESGQIFQEIAADPEAREAHSLKDLSRTAAGFGLGAGAIDALPIARVFDKFGVGKAGREAIRDGLFKRAAKGAVTNAGVEGATEGVQTAIERSAHKFVNDNFEIFGEEGVREILNATAGGAALGGLLGPLEGLAGTPRGSIEERMARMEADEELGAAFGKAGAGLEGIVANESRDINAPDDISTRARIARARASGKFDAAKDSSRGPASIIRSHAKQEHLGDLDAPTLDVITKLATGEAELTPQVRELLEPRFHYFDTMIDQVRSRFGLKPENVQIEGTQSGLDTATGEQAAELTKPVAGDGGQAARDEQGNLVRPTETQAPRPAKFRFQGDLDGAASLGLAKAVHGKEFADTSTQRELLRLRDDDPDADYDLVPLDEALRAELGPKGMSKAEVRAELGRRGQARFEQAMGKLTDPEKQARLQSLFDPRNPAAFLKNFEVIREQGLPQAVQQGDEDVLTQEHIEGDKVIGRKSVFGERPRKRDELYDGQFLVTGSTKPVNAPRLVRRMLQRQGVKDLDNPTLDQIKSAFGGALVALDKLGMKVSKSLSDRSTVAYSGGKRVFYSDIKTTGQARLEARVKGLREQQTSVGAQMQTQDTLIHAGKIPQAEGAAKIKQLGATADEMQAQQDLTEAQLREVKALRTKANELEQQIKAAEQTLVRELTKLLPKTAARIEKALGERNHAGLFTRLHQARDAIEEKGNTAAAKAITKFLNEVRGAYTRLDNVAKKLDKLGVVHTSPGLEGFRDDNAAFAEAQREEERAEEKPEGEFQTEQRRHVTSDSKLAAAEKLVARGKAVESLIGPAAYGDGPFDKALVEVGRMLGNGVVAELKRAKIDTREKLVAWLERQRIEAGTVLGLIDSTEGRFDEEGVDPIVGREAYVKFRSESDIQSWASQLVDRVAEIRREEEDTLIRAKRDGRSIVVHAAEEGLKRLKVVEKKIPSLLPKYVALISDKSLTDRQLDNELRALAGGSLILFRAMLPPVGAPVPVVSSIDLWDTALELEGVEKLDAKFAELQKTLDGWAKALGMSDLGIKLVKPSEIKGFVPKVAGAGAGEFLSRLRTAEVGGAYYSGANVILLSPFTDPAIAAELLAHEFGHAVFANEVVRLFASKDPNEVAQAEAITKDFLAWREKYGRGDAKIKDILASKKALLSAAGFASLGDAALGNMAPKDREYILDFNEWFADQVSRALTSEGKPQNLVEKFFADLVEKVKKLLGILKDSPEGKFLPDRSVAEFLQAMSHERRLEAMETRSRPTEQALMDALCQRYKEAGGRGHTGRQKLFEYLNKDAKQAASNRSRLSEAVKNLGAEGVEGQQSRVVLPKTSPYTAKDQAKSDKATKFIGRGSMRSSTAAYAKAWGERANSGQYTAEDRVFVSTEGNRGGRKALDTAELGLATSAGATIITDNQANRERAYNVGEREAATFLKSQGYRETSPGVWTPEQGVKGNESREIPTPEAVQAAEQVSAGAGQQHAPFSEQARLKVKRAITSWLKPEERRALGRAFSSPHVMRQLRAALKAFPAILDKVERDPLEALSYGYQLWMAGQIDLGPKTQNLFQSFHDFIEELFGLVSEGKEAENVLRALSKNLDAGARDPLLNILEGPTKTGRLNRVAKFTNNTYKDVHHLFGKMFYTASSRMYHTGNPVLRQLADLVQPRAGGEGAKQGMLEARRERIARFLTQRARLFEGVSEETKAKVLELLQNPKMGTADPELGRLVEGQRKLLREVFQYTKSKGVAIGDLGTDYFPWVFDPKAMIDHAAAFTAMLSQPKYAAKIAELAKEWDVDPKDVPGMIAGQIAEAGGVADSHLTAAGAMKRTPYMASLNPRNLDWIRTLGDEKDMATLSKLLSKDLDGTVINYVHQAVKRAEFVSRFGEKGEKLESMFKQAQQLGASDDDLKLAGHYLAAVTGTLGTGTNERLAALFGGKHTPGQVINPALRLGMSALMVAQNLAILGLATFTSLADPVGILVRGGSLSEGLEALKAGAKEIMAAAKGEKTDLKSLAEALGAIEDSATTEALEWEYGSTYLTPGLKWTNEMFFKTIGLTQWTRITRLMALAGARKFLEKHGRVGFTKHSKRYLDQLGLKEGDVQYTGGELKVLTRLEREAASKEERARDDRVRSALNRFVDESILRPNATQRPIWASDPHWMLVWHLKSFTYSFYETILKRVVNELGERNAAPALMLSLFVPAMLAADLLRELFTEGEVDDDKDLGERLVFATERSGLTGLKQFLLDAQQDRQYGGVGIESFAGPTAAMIGRVPSLFADDSGQRWSAFQKSLPYQNVWKHWVEEGTGAGG